jgi:hypothetical protein
MIKEVKPSLAYNQELGELVTFAPPLVKAAANALSVTQKYGEDVLTTERSATR